MEEVFEKSFELENQEELMNEMMNKYGQDLLRLVYSYVNNKEIAEDLTQDIFVKFYQSIHTFKGNSKLKTWLWRIAINHCKDFLKSWYNKHVFIAEHTENSPTQKEIVEEAIIQKEADDQLIAVLMTLPIKYREVIYLYYYEERLLKEIAVLTEVSVNTVKTRLSRAKELLEERLEET